jgi:RimJ/RimL family protein N-acetyltransferase
MMQQDVRLRDLVEADLDTLCKWRNDPQVSHFLSNRVKTQDEVVGWFRRITDTPKNLLKGIMVGDRLVGYCIVEDVDGLNGKCEVGIVIGDTTSWGRGVGRIVGQKLLKYCFAELHLHRVLAVVAKGNARSEALFRGLGFVHEGTLREATVIDGSHTDLLCYSMLKQEYGRTGTNEAMDSDD